MIFLTFLIDLQLIIRFRSSTRFLSVFPLLSTFISDAFASSSVVLNEWVNSWHFHYINYYQSLSQSHRIYVQFSALMPPIFRSSWFNVVNNGLWPQPHVLVKSSKSIAQTMPPPKFNCFMNCALRRTSATSSYDTHWLPFVAYGPILPFESRVTFQPSTFVFTQIS